MNTHHSSIQKQLQAVYDAVAFGGDAHWEYPDAEEQAHLLGRQRLVVQTDKGDTHEVFLSDVKEEMAGFPDDHKFRILVRTRLGRDRLLQALVLSAQEHSLVTCHA